MLLKIFYVQMFYMLKIKYEKIRKFVFIWYFVFIKQ